MSTTIALITEKYNELKSTLMSKEYAVHLQQILPPLDNIEISAIIFVMNFMFKDKNIHEVLHNLLQQKQVNLHHTSVVEIATYIDDFLVFLETLGF